MMYDLRQAKFVSAETIVCDSPFVRITARGTGNDGEPERELEFELGHGKSLSEVSKLCLKIRLAKNPLAYALAVDENENSSAVGGDELRLYP